MAKLFSFEGGKENRNQKREQMRNKFREVIKKLRELSEESAGIVMSTLNSSSEEDDREVRRISEIRHQQPYILELIKRDLESLKDSDSVFYDEVRKMLRESSIPISFE